MWRENNNLYGIPLKKDNIKVVIVMVETYKVAIIGNSYSYEKVSFEMQIHHYKKRLFLRDKVTITRISQNYMI